MHCPSTVGMALLLGWMLTARLASAADLSPELQAAAREEWEKEIVALEARDAAESHPADSVLFVGSSTIRLWKTIARDMAPYPAIQRGYGGAEFSDLAVFAERLIAPHRFRALVVFVANDVTRDAEDPTPQQVATWFGHVVDVARAVEARAHIFCLEITPTQARWEAWPEIQAVNQALARECALRTGVHFIPTAHAYLGPNGEPQTDLFEDDRLHLNELGYRIWAAIIKSHLDARLQTDDAGEEAPPDAEPAGIASPGLSTSSTQPTSRIPLLYCSDLFHPHDDPDDHFDLATLYALEKETADPVGFLRQPVDPARREALFAQTRNLWCTAVFRSLTVAGPPRGEGFFFEKTEMAIGDDGLLGAPAHALARTVHRFKVQDPERYATQMTQATADILAAFPVVSHELH